MAKRAHQQHRHRHIPVPTRGNAAPPQQQEGQRSRQRSLESAAKRRKLLPTFSLGDRIFIGSLIGIFVLYFLFVMSAAVARSTTGRCLKCVLTRDYQCALCPPPSFQKAHSRSPGR